MCIVNISYEQHDHYCFVLAANRDEFFERSTAPLHIWEDTPHVIGGRDLVSMGSWLAVTKEKRIAALTNFRDQVVVENPKSRGSLIANFVQHQQPAVQYIKNIEHEKAKYGGYNLLLYENHKLFFHTNRGTGPLQVEKGIYSISNGHFHAKWPKTIKGKSLLQDTISLKGEKLVTTLLDRLTDNAVAPDEQLPSTGVGMKAERMLSPLFIQSPGYGTRCSTVVLLNKEGQGLIIERTYDSNGKTTDRNMTF